MLSISKVASYMYLPRRLREGAETTLQQAKNVYTTLKLNNVPSELPSFLLSQISEVVETQINYCRQLGGYINSALKVTFFELHVQDGMYEALTLETWCHSFKCLLSILVHPLPLLTIPQQLCTVSMNGLPVHFHEGAVPD